jgi:AraC-like DNA-binding protein
MNDRHPFLYFELRSPPALREYVQTYWGFDVRHASEVITHTVWPDGCLSLLCRVRPGEPGHAVFSGPRVEPLRVPVREGESYRGVRLWPWAIGPLLEVDPSALRDRSGPATDVLGTDAVALPSMAMPQEVFPALERVLLARAASAPAPDPVIRAAVEIISSAAGTCSIAQVASRAGRLGERQLRRRFRAVTGLSPKEYARVRRLRTTGEARIRGGAGWSRLAASFGFADQAHLVREIARMTGLTPTAFEERLQLIEHRDTRA